MNQDWQRLAGEAGIEDAYWDGLGVRRDLSEPSAAALLAALGFDSSADPRPQYEALLRAPFLTPLPHTTLAERGITRSVLIALPSELRDQVIGWELALESGAALQGEFIATQLPLVDEHEFGGRRFARYRLALKADVPSGYHRFRLPSLNAETLLIVAPPRCFIPDALAQGGRRWGLAVQLYSLRSQRNWGIGDFGDLATVASTAGRAGAAFIGLNPLHARHLAHPDEASPYAPASRIFLDPVYIDVPSVSGFAECATVQATIAASEFSDRLERARASARVDYAAVTEIKLQVLRQLHEDFRRRSRETSDDEVIEFGDFILKGGKPLAQHSLYQARSLHVSPNEIQIEFQMYLQWLAAKQLAAAAKTAKTAGMSVGLYRDLAVGAASDSAESAGEPELFAHGIFIGAPPDMLNRQGQNWGLVPWNPRELARREFAPFRAMLSENMRNAGALRIDHVMALTRLFWIPRGMSGADGGYVRNPFETLAAIVAIESERNRCMVIGEDLGAVPDGLRDRLHELGFLSYRVLVYERHWKGDGRFCLPHEYPQQALATVATHDMPTMTEFWRGEDIVRRDGLGLYPTAQQRDEDAARRRGERDGMLWLLGESGLSPADPADPAEAIAALHQAVARSQSMLAAIQLDDLVGETEPVNIPGTYREYPNWRRKLSIPIEAIFSDDRWRRLVAVMVASKRSDQSLPG